MTLLEEELARILRPLVAQARAVAGALVFTPPREAPVVVRAAGRRLPARLDGWLQASVRTPVGRLGLARATPPGWTRGRAVVLKTPLVASGRRVGALLLLGPALTRGTLTPDVSRALGEALDRVWRLHRRALRMSALDELTRLLVVTHSLDDVFRAFAEGAAKLVAFDSIAVSLLDAERDEFEIIDVVARSVPLRVPRDDRMALAGTLFADLVARGTPLRVDDVRDERVPGVSRRVFAERGYRAVTLVPLRSGPTSPTSRPTGPGVRRGARSRSRSARGSWAAPPRAARRSVSTTSAPTRTRRAATWTSARGFARCSACRSRSRAESSA